MTIANLVVAAIPTYSMQNFAFSDMCVDFYCNKCGAGLEDITHFLRHISHKKRVRGIS